MDTIFDLESLLKSKSILYSNCKDCNEAIAIILRNEDIDAVSFPKQYIFNLTAGNTSKVDNAYVFEFILHNNTDIINIENITNNSVGGEIKVEYFADDKNLGNISKYPIFKLVWSRHSVRLTFINNPIDTSIEVNTRNLILSSPISKCMLFNKFTIDGINF
jgi:hypothetical protein